MEQKQSPPLSEVWQRGPITGIPSLLQPVAHALLQAQEELHELMMHFPASGLWKRPAGLASPAFHLQHLSGVLDRVFTYASGNLLNENQLLELQKEDIIFQEDQTIDGFVDRFDMQVARCLKQLEMTPENSLTEWRGVGRMQLPSTVIGLLVHGAEHTMRHLGQLLVTVKVIQNQS